MEPFFVRLRYQWNIEAILRVTLLTMLGLSTFAFAEDQRLHAGEMVDDRAKAAWMDGDPTRALDILDQAIRDSPDAHTLQKLRGDILAHRTSNASGVLWSTTS